MMTALRTPHARCPGSLVEVFADGAPLGGAVLGAGAFLAIDRPDRLEIRWNVPYPAARLELEPRLVPGSTLRMVLCGEAVLEGTVDRVAWSASAREGLCLRAVAYSSYHGRRLRHGTQVHYQVTDSELAERVAAFLGLFPVAERTEGVHPRVAVEGDPLAFLRARAEACGRRLAVTSGKLYFTEAFPEPEDLIAVSTGREVLEFEVLRQLEGPRGWIVGDDGGRKAGSHGGRGGRLKVVGDPRWRPLAGLELRGLAPSVNGRYRVLRALHRLGPRGYETLVDFVEEGVHLTGRKGDFE